MSPQYRPEPVRGEGGELPERELDRQVPRDHPVGKRVEKLLQDLLKRYGGPPQADTTQRRPPTEEYEETEGEQ